MKLLAAALLVLLVLLQYRLWASPEGMREVWTLSGAVAVQREENAGLSERNRQLKAEVADLKQGLTALEERARHDLGMVTASETFFQVVEAPHLAPDAVREPPVVTSVSASP